MLKHFLAPALFAVSMIPSWFAGMGRADGAELPRVLDPRLELQLVAEHPDIVTPIGATIDHLGRLLVIESHTHFPPEDYSGPKSDRIRILEDSDGDGRMDRFRTFWEGGKWSMSLARGPKPWIYVATRMNVFRICDRDQDDVAETVEELVRLDTPGDYPHNGLCGLTFDSEGHLYFGLGENLGEPYSLVGRDGRTRRGGGEGGNIYRCALDGTQLEQIATGFWNPFGMCIDESGRLFAVGNDPDARPPCRLLHIVPGGDYGYQFRYGRSGRHPLQAWDGELPGTLPMVAGTGEAPCAVLPLDGHLWVTVWGDNRIERFRLRPSGASFVATSETVIQGDHEFRPVDFALGPSGDLYFTDWVDKSYPVHGRGRVWRVCLKRGATWSANGRPQLTADERTAQQLRTRVAWDMLGHADPFLRHAAVWGLIAHADSGALDWDAAQTSPARLALLQYARWQLLAGQSPPQDWIKAALGDDDADVRLYAVRLVADAKLASLRPLLERQLTDRVTSPRLFWATLAALDWLDRGTELLNQEPSYGKYLLPVMLAPDSPSPIRAMALELIDPNHPQLDLSRLEHWLADDDASVRREVIRTLVIRARTDDGAAALLARVAEDSNRLPCERADAVAGLPAERRPYRALVERLATLAETNRVGKEARRALRPRSTPAAAEPPSAAELDAWLADSQEAPDAAAGWRVFFANRSTACSRCHRLDGRGSSIGPDLTGIGGWMSRQRILQSLLDPSREIAPQYTAWILELNDGRVFLGLPVGRSSDHRAELFVTQQGETLSVPPSDIVARHASPTSIMPTGFHQLLTHDELRDLVALLERGEE